jgi:hypothetical protein
MQRNWKRLFGLCLVALLISTASSLVAAEKPKVLYFTHEPGRWHKYGPQKELFKAIGKEAGWEVTVMTGSHDDQLKKLKIKDYGKGYDAIVYNFCFAHAKDLEAASNLMAQTRENGVPCMLIHCAMHSWWATYKSGKSGALGPKYKGKAKANPKLVEQWRASHGDKPFPAWGDFTGIASTRHGPHRPIKMVAVAKHPATARFPKEGLTTGNTELYNNVYQLDTVVPLVEGTQGRTKYTVMWTCPQGKSQVMGLTVGHNNKDWTFKPYQHLIIDGLNYLIKNPKP